MSNYQRVRQGAPRCAESETAHSAKGAPRVCMPPLGGNTTAHLAPGNRAPIRCAKIRRTLSTGKEAA